MISIIITEGLRSKMKEIQGESFRKFLLVSRYTTHSLIRYVNGSASDSGSSKSRKAPKSQD